MTIGHPGSTILSKSLSCTVSEVNAFYAEFQDGHQKWCGNDFWKKCQMTAIPWASKVLSANIVGKQFLAKIS